MRLPLLLVESVMCMTRTEDWLSLAGPQIRREHTTCVTLSKVVRSHGTLDRMEPCNWSSQMSSLMVTDVGKGGCISLSTSEYGGKGDDRVGGGSTGGVQCWDYQQCHRCWDGSGEEVRVGLGFSVIRYSEGGDMIQTNALIRIIS